MSGGTWLLVGLVLLAGAMALFVYVLRRQRRLGTSPRRVGGVRVAPIVIGVCVVLAWVGALIVVK